MLWGCGCDEVVLLYACDLSLVEGADMERAVAAEYHFAVYLGRVVLGAANVIALFLSVNDNL